MPSVLGGGGGVWAGAVVRCACLKIRRSRFEPGSGIQVSKSRKDNSVSGGQCHLIHLIILMRFSWHSLAYIMHKSGLKPHPFHFISLQGSSL